MPKLDKKKTILTGIVLIIAVVVIFIGTFLEHLR